MRRRPIISNELSIPSTSQRLDEKWGTKEREEE
jgi:hypothetical protein